MKSCPVEDPGHGCRIAVESGSGAEGTKDMKEKRCLRPSDPSAPLRAAPSFPTDLSFIVISDLLLIDSFW